MGGLRPLTGRIRATHVIAGLDPIYGGPSYSVPRLCEALAAAGAETVLLSVAAREGGQCDVYHNGYRDCRYAWDYRRIPILRQLRSSHGLTIALRKAARVADVIHSHGLWLLPNVSAGGAAASAPTALVISPRGMLAPAALAFSRLKKRAFWAFLQGQAICRAACIHATSEQEYEEIRSFGLTGPVAIIPNGIDVPELPVEAMPRPTAKRVVLSLGRIHPKKGLSGLLNAWSKIEVSSPGWWLRILGPPEAGHDNELRALAIALGLTRVSVESALHGDARTVAYREADVFVLPSLNENFGLTVAESLAAGTPAISTKGAPWSGLVREGCGWWIDHGVEPLVAALAQATTLPRATLKAMGDKGREWMVRDFSWERVAHDIVDVYLWVARDAEPPPLVRLQ